MFNRNDSFSIKLDNIKDTLNIGNDLLFFTTDSVYKMLLAEVTDPDKDNPNTKHSYEKIYSVGTRSIFIARLIIQFYKIFEVLTPYIDKSKEIIAYIWNTNKLIIDCFLICQSVCNETNKLIPNCNDIINKNKHNSVIPSLPQVPELEKNVGSFFNKAKLFLIESFKIFKIFFKMPIKEKKASHFNKHLKSIDEQLGNKHPIVERLKKDINWIKLISEIRNAFEHPKDGQIVSVHNFKFKKGNKFSQPSWSYHLTSKIQKNQDASDLISDLNTMLNKMLHFFENMLVLSIQDKLKKNDILELVKIPEEEIDDECPLAYRITVKSNFLSTIK